jgi:hypothetical protein
MPPGFFDEIDFDVYSKVRYPLSSLPKPFLDPDAELRIFVFRGLSIKVEEHLSIDLKDFFTRASTDVPETRMTVIMNVATRYFIISIR